MQRVRPLAGLADIDRYAGHAAAAYQSAMERIAVVIDNLGQAETELAFHRRCLGQWRETLERSARTLYREPHWRAK